MGRKLRQVENISAHLFCCGKKNAMMFTIEIFYNCTHDMRGGSKITKDTHTHIQYISKPLRGFHENIIRGTQNNLQFLRALVDMQ